MKPHILIVIVAMIGCSSNSSTATQEKLRRLRDHCQVTSVAFDMDARDLSSGDPKRQEQAANRMIGTAVHHSWEDIVLCAATRPASDSVDQCWLAKDFACLAKIARAAADATKP